MSINLKVLDPNTYKQSLIDYLKTQTVFKDYNFEDSNINVILDVLSHNTYVNSFYKNMIFNESQLDSCLLRSSAISKAKELNYVPLSKRSSKARIKITIQAENITSLELPKGTQFSGKGNLTSFTFTTNKSYIAKSSSGIFTFPDVEIFEGAYFTDTYIIDSSIEDQKVIVSNKDVDTTSLEVVSIDYNTSETILYKRKETSFDLVPTSEIYFLEGYAEDQYRVVFGQDVLGKQPTNGSSVVLLYRVVSGANGADFISEFSLDEDIVLSSGGILESIQIDTLDSSSGGSNSEDIEDIKFKSPRYFAAQESAVTSTNYKSLILKEFSSNLKDVNVYGGEKHKPKKYGKVIIVLKPNGSDITTQTVKNDIFSFIQDFNVGAVTPIIIDAENFYLKINSTVQYDPSNTSLFLKDINTSIFDSIKTYSNSQLESFGGDFRYSKFMKAIDDKDKSIISNDTEVLLVKRLIPKINSDQKFYINFGNKIVGLTSSLFTWLKDSSPVEDCYLSFMDGDINIVKLDQTQKETTIEKKIGTINLLTGEINITKMTLASFNKINPYLEVIVSTESKDIIIPEDKILNISDSDITINIIKALS